MLDYNFVREKMGENPDLEERDRRFDAAVAGTGWPLVKQVKVCVPAGSVILVSAQQLPSSSYSVVRLKEAACAADEPQLLSSGSAAEGRSGGLAGPRPLHVAALALPNHGAGAGAGRCPRRG